MSSVLPTLNSCCSPGGQCLETTNSIELLIQQAIALQLPFVNVTNFGAIGDGVTDSTASVKKAYDSIANTGGILFFPNATGRFLFNITILNDNITMFGVLRDVNVNTNRGIGPFSTTLPVVQIGNDSNVVNGFGMINLAVFGNKGSAQCPSCVYFAGGCENADISFCQFIGGVDTLYFRGGVNFPSTTNKVSHFAAWEGTNSTVRMVYPIGGSYTTANGLTDGHINGNNSTGYTIILERAEGHFTDVYCDMEPLHGLLCLDGGKFIGTNCNLDNDAGSAVVTVQWTTGPNPDYDISRYVSGLNDIQGTIYWTDSGGTTIKSIPGIGIHASFDRITLRQPWVTVPFTVGTVLNPLDNVYTFDLFGTSGPLLLSKGANADYDVQWAAQNTFHQYALGNVQTRVFYDLPSITNSAGSFEYFRSTNTSGLLNLIVYKGDNTNTKNHELSANADSFLCANNGKLGVGTDHPTSIIQVVGLPVYANNAGAVTGGLTVGAFYRTGSNPDPVCVVH